MYDSIWITHTNQMYRYRKQIFHCLGLARSGWTWGVTANGDGILERNNANLLNLDHSVAVVQLLSCVRLLQPREQQHTRLPSPSLSPGVCSNSCPSSQWCHPTISSSVVPFSSCPQSFPVSGPFPMSRLFASGSQSIGALASASVLPMNIQDWFPLGLTGLISLQSKGLSRVFSSTIQKPQFFSAQPSLWANSVKKTIAWTVCIFVSRVMSLLLTMLSGFVTAFLPRSQRLLIWWLQSLFSWFWSPRK